MEAKTNKTDAFRILEDAAIRSKTLDREMNLLVRNALLRTHQEMYSEPIKVRPFHRYYGAWVGRTSFYNLLEMRGGVSLERAIGLLASDRELRIAVGLNPDNLTDEEICVVRKALLKNLASASLLEWLLGIKNCATFIPPLLPSGGMSKEENS